MKKVIKIAFWVMLLCFTVQHTNVEAQFFNMASPLIGKEVPPFKLKTLGSGEMSLEEFSEGENTIVFFWATWCPHCRKELTRLNDARGAIEDKKIKLAIVDLGESESVVESYVKKNNIELNMFLDIESTLAEPYALIGVPTFYFVNKQGIIEDVTHSLPENLDKIFTN